jgi:ATP-binding cassette subfamily F protein uup
VLAVTILTATGLTKSYGPHVVLQGVDLAIDEGERVGLVGENGSGKSTIARILAGKETADSGERAVRREARVMYLEQEPQLDPAYDVLETVLMGLGSWWLAKERYEAASKDLEAGRDLEAALARQTSALADMERDGGFTVSHRALSVTNSLGVRDPHARVDRLSGGEKRRVALARLLVAEPHLAILDEPTNHLDIDAIEWLESHLADTYRGSVLLITHDRYFLDGVVDRTLEIERGVMYGYQGGFADYLRGKAERIALAERTEQNRQNFLRKELDWLSRSPSARTTKQRARIDRAESAVASKPQAEKGKLDLELTTTRSGKSVLDLDHIALDTPAEARDQRRLVTDLTLHLTQGERVGVLGPNGSGKSTLLKAILGEHPLAAGRSTLGKNARVAYLSQHRTGLDEDKSILENVTGGSTHVRIGDRDVHAMSYLEKFLFKGSEVKKPVKALSGGERTRVALAKLLKQQTNLLLLDEPTNDLDLDTLAALEELLIEHDITAIVVTHDRWFLDRIATSILWFEGDGRVTRVAGNFTSVREYREANRAPREKPVQAASTQSAASAPKAKKPGLSYKEQKELDGIEGQIAELDARVSELDALLSDGSIYQTRAAEVTGLVAERDDKRHKSEQLMERWAELEEKRSQG